MSINILNLKYNWKCVALKNVIIIMFNYKNMSEYVKRGTLKIVPMQFKIVYIN